MKNLEIIKLKTENLREILKFLLMLILATITAEITIFYKLLLKTLPFYFVIISGIGIFVLFFEIAATKKLWEYMNEILKDRDD